MMPRAAVVGYYGMCNAGDDAFAIILSRAVPEFWGFTPIICSPPLRGLAPSAVSLPPALFGKHTGPQRWARTAVKVVFAARARLVIFGGGSVFRQMGPFSEKRWYRMLSRIGRVATAAIGVSVGPFADARSEARLRRVLAELDYIAVRDQRSLEYLSSLDLRRPPVLGADLVALLAEPGSDPRHTPDGERGSERPHIALGVIGWDPALPHETIRERNAALTRAVRNVARARGARVSVVVMNSNAEKGDLEASREAERVLRESGVDCRLIRADGSPLDLLEVLRSCDAGVHIRLHGGLFSFVANLPFVQVPYHIKCMDLVDDLGVPDCCRVGPLPTSEEVEAALEDALDGAWATRVTPLEWKRRALDAFLGAPWARERAYA